MPVQQSREYSDRLDAGIRRHDGNNHITVMQDVYSVDFLHDGLIAVGQSRDEFITVGYAARERR